MKTVNIAKTGIISGAVAAAAIIFASVSMALGAFETTAGGNVTVCGFTVSAQDTDNVSCETTTTSNILTLLGGTFTITDNAGTENQGIKIVDNAITDITVAGNWTIGPLASVATTTVTVGATPIVSFLPGIEVGTNARVTFTIPGGAIVNTTGPATGPEQAAITSGSGVLVHPTGRFVVLGAGTLNATGGACTTNNCTTGAGIAVYD